MGFLCTSKDSPHFSIRTVMFTFDLRIIGSLIAAASGTVGIVVGFSKFIRWIQRKEKNPYAFKVKHIKDIGGADLSAALDLYEGRFLEYDSAQMDSKEDIIRWLSEANNKKQQERLREDFFIATRKGRVVGGLYTQYYKKSRYLFISYLFVKKGGDGPIGLHLAKYLKNFVKKELKECKGVLFESISESTGNKLTKKDGHIRHFRFIARQIGFKARQVVINYLQPKLSLWDGDSKERNLALLYVSLDDFQSSEFLPRSEVENILNFIYEDLYGDCFAYDESKDTEYRAYLKILSQRVMSVLPDQIQLS